MSILERIKKFLTGPVNLLVYIFTILAGFNGLVFSFASNSPEVQNSPIFHQGIFLGFNVWGILVFIGAALMVFGLIKRLRLPTEVGSMLSFMMWIFAGISVFQIGYYLSLVGFAAYLLIFAYIYLASALGILKEIDEDRASVVESEKHHDD